MTKSKQKSPLELPEYLTPEEMRLFMTNPNVRAARRAERLAKLAPPSGGVAIRGYTRDWLFDGVEAIPRPENVDPELAKLLQIRMVGTRPLTDKITDRYDILPNQTSAKKYGLKAQRNFLDRVRDEETDPARIVVFEQGAVRMLEHTRDNLQRNLWLKKRVGEWRLAFVDTALSKLDRGVVPQDDLVRHTGGAIADLGFCLRGQTGLLKNVGVDISAANSIEHLGLFVAAGQPDVLGENRAVVELTLEEQERRVKYWGDRYKATTDAFNNRLPEDDLAMDQDLDLLISALYDQEATATQVNK